MKHFFFGILIFTRFILPSSAQNVSVSIENAGKEFPALKFYTPNNPFFENITKSLGEIRNPEEEIILDLDETTCIYTDYGPYKCYFFAEPGIKYKLQLPALSGLSDEWKNNPYFKREKYHLSLKSDHEESGISGLNTAIKNFNKEYEPFLDAQILRYYQPRLAKQARDSFFRQSFASANINDPAFYEDYLRFKKGILEFSNQSHNLDSLIHNYISEDKSHFSNPAYLELFEILFQDYYNFLSQKPGFEQLATSFGRISLKEIVEILEKDSLIQNEISKAFIILNESYKSYYSGQGNKNTLRTYCTNIPQYFDYPIIREMASTLLKEFTHMEAGYKVPEFICRDIHDREISLSQADGKYLYIGFLDIERMGSLGEIEYLKFIHAHHSRYIRIITFIIDKDAGKVKEFAENSSLNWTIIPVQKNDPLLMEYKVRALPVFYLIEKDGTLLQNPAPAPSENFEFNLFELLRSRNEL